MTRLLKRPDGQFVIEERVDEVFTLKDGILRRHGVEPNNQRLESFYFRVPGMRDGLPYTVQTAPQWLLALYKEATG